MPSYLLSGGQEKPEYADVKKVKLTFLDRTILNSAKAVKSIYQQAESAARVSFIQKIHPKVKFLSLIYLVIVISFIRELPAQLIATGFIFLFYLVARLRIVEVYRKIFFLALIFGLVVVLPASLNVITPGEIIFPVLRLNSPVHFLIYNIPAEIGITVNGIQVVSMVFLRVFNSVSLALLIVYTTSFPAFVKSFKIVGIPDLFLMIISLAYKYIFILSRTIEETYFALKSRMSGNIKKSSIRKLIGGRMFFIFRRSVIIYENTYYAMVSRCYNGKVILHSYQKVTSMDIAVAVVILVLGIFLILV